MIQLSFHTATNTCLSSSSQLSSLSSLFYLQRFFWQYTPPGVSGRSAHASSRGGLIITIHSLIDTFQGCYKDGTNGTRDYRAIIIWLYILLGLLAVPPLLGLIVLLHQNYSFYWQVRTHSTFDNIKYCMYCNNNYLYTIGLYPLLMIAVIYVIVQLYDRYCTTMRHNCRLCCCVPLLRRFEIRSALIDAFATFLVLAYVTIGYTSVSILEPTTVYTPDRVYKLFAYADASMEFMAHGNRASKVCSSSSFHYCDLHCASTTLPSPLSPDLLPEGVELLWL